MENMKSLKKFYKNKTVLVTGATGFKGSWLCLWLNYLGAKVIAIGFSPNRNNKLYYSLELNKFIQTKILDVRDFKKTESFLKKIKPKIIIHMAAQPIIYDSYIKPYETYNINTFGTLNILEISRSLKTLKALVCVTSDKCYQDNLSTTGFKEGDKLGGEDPYSGSKASAEIVINTYIKSYFHKKKLGVASARAGNVIGGGDYSKDRLVPDSINFLNDSKMIYLRNPNFNRPWQHVIEPLYGYLILAKKLFEQPIKYSGAYNFGSKKNTVTSVEEVVKKIIKYWGSGNYKSNKKKKYYEQKNLQLNINKAEKILKWKPKLSIDSTIKITVSWYKEFLNKNKNMLTFTLKQIEDYMQS